LVITFFLLKKNNRHILIQVQSSLVRWKNATGMRDFTFIAEHVTKTLHGKNTGPWSLSFKVLRDNNQNNRQIALKDSKLLYQVSLAQQPGHVYCMVDGSVVVEAEKEMEIILSRLKNLWQLRQSVTIEVIENVQISMIIVCILNLC
jgi:mediator of RNA polymerase II transcription subunit 20